MTINRRTFLVSAAIAPMWSMAARAGTHSAFEDAVFRQAQEAGKPVLIHVTAPWCGTCKAQKPIVAELMSAPDFAEYQVFEVDFDTQKNVLQEFAVQRQSTMIVFKGKTEIERTLGETRSDAIEAMLRKAL